MAVPVAAVMQGAGLVKTLMDDGKKGYNQMKQHMLNLAMMEEQYKYNESAADNADERQRKQYEDMYSPSAMSKSLKAAGYNPAIIGGISGGTATGASGGGTGLGQSVDLAKMSSAKSQAMSTMFQGVELAEMKSRIKLNESAANKNQADADKTSGVDTETAIANLGLIAKNIKNQELQNDILTIDKSIKEATSEADISMAWNELHRGVEELGYLRERQKTEQAQRDVMTASIKQMEAQTGLAEEQSQSYKLDNIVKYGTLKEQIALQGIMAISDKAAEIASKEAGIGLTKQEIVNKQWDALTTLVEIENWQDKLPAMTQLANFARGAVGGRGAKETGAQATDTIFYLMSMIINPVETLSRENREKQTKGNQGNDYKEMYPGIAK